MKTTRNFIRTAAVLFTAALSITGLRAGDHDQHKTARATVNRLQISDDRPPLKVVELGFHYMPTFYNLDLKTSSGNVVKGSATVAHGFGGMLAFNLSPNIGIQGEVDYYQMNQKFSDQSLSNRVKIKYLDIPLLLSLNTNKRAVVNLNAVAGPQFGINVGSDVNVSGSGNTGTAQAVVGVRKGDIGLAYGAGLEFAINQSHTVRIDLGYRGFYGFVNMDADKSGADTYNVVVAAHRKTNAAYARLTFCF